MLRITASFLIIVLLGSIAFGQASGHRPLRVGIVGLVHGHVHGFLEQSRNSPAIEIVGIAEPDRQLLSQAAGRYGFGQDLLFTDLENMLAKVHPFLGELREQLGDPEVFADIEKVVKRTKWGRERLQFLLRRMDSWQARLANKGQK